MTLPCCGDCHCSRRYGELAENASTLVQLLPRAALELVKIFYEYPSFGLVNRVVSMQKGDRSHLLVIIRPCTVVSMTQVITFWVIIQHLYIFITVYDHRSVG
jgi:hypothetical protein